VGRPFSDWVLETKQQKNEGQVSDDFPSDASKPATDALPVLGMASPPGPGAGGRGPIALSPEVMPSRSSEPLLQGKRDQKRDHAHSARPAAAAVMWVHLF
jgi:hypothetical protein